MSKCPLIFLYCQQEIHSAQSSQTQLDIVTCPSFFPAVQLTVIQTLTPLYLTLTPLQQSSFTRDGSFQPLSRLIFNLSVTICMRWR